jgi:hypothetical protein
MIKEERLRLQWAYSPLVLYGGCPRIGVSTVVASSWSRGDAISIKRRHAGDVKKKTGSGERNGRMTVSLRRRAQSCLVAG